jgi:hypothetical protein
MLSLEAKRAWSRRAVVAKARKLLASTAVMTDVGGFRSDGCLGIHTVRLLAYPGESRALAITMDGIPKQPRTFRGIRNALAKMFAEHFREFHP